MPRTAKSKQDKDQIEEAIENAEVVEDIVPADYEEAVTGECVAAEPLPIMVPKHTDPGWQAYVLGQFDPSEFDPEGNPTAEACRLVVERLLGPIVSERIHTVQVPTPENDYRATVEVSIQIAWGGDVTDIREFEDVADVYPGNMDPRYAQFPTASAKTKALGRACKSALKLRKVYTTEELSYKEVPSPGAGFTPLINLSQQRFIEKMCRVLDMNVSKFINSGKGKYTDISQVPYEKVERMVQKLNTYQQDKSTIPEEIRGYNPNWRKS